MFRVYIHHKIDLTRFIADLKYNNTQDMKKTFDTLVNNNALLIHNSTT